jgi:hypothetical protein
MCVCRKCGQLRAMFSVNHKSSAQGGEAFVDTGTCVSCRHGKRPSAQVKWVGNVKAWLIHENRRKAPKGAKA